MYRKVIRNKKAFTLSETLIAVLIMLMVSSILVTGIPAAKNAYEKVFVKSNAELLKSTTISALRNELSVAKDIKVTNDTTVTYSSRMYGTTCQLSIGNYGIKIQRNILDEETSSRLVSSAASDKMIVKYDSVTEPDNNGVMTFTKLGVYKVSMNSTNDNGSVTTSYTYTPVLPASDLSIIVF